MLFQGIILINGTFSSTNLVLIITHLLSFFFLSLLFAESASVITIIWLPPPESYSFFDHDRSHTKITLTDTIALCQGEQLSYLCASLFYGEFSNQNQTVYQCHKSSRCIIIFQVVRANSFKHSSPPISITFMTNNYYNSLHYNDKRYIASIVNHFQ